MSDQKQEQKRPLWKELRTYFVGAFFLLELALIVQLLQLQVLPMKYLIPMIICLILFSILLWWMQFGKQINKTNRIMGKILIVVCSIILVFANLYVLKTQHTLGSIAGENIETDAMSIIVLKDSSVNEIQDLKEGSFGAYEAPDQENIEATKKDLHEVLKTTIQYESKDSYNDLAKSLYDKEVDAIILNEAYRGLFENQYPTFDEDTKVIYQHKIEKETADISKNVNVATTPFNIYITGIDTYGPVSTKSRSDVNMIATVNPVTKRIVLTSIPRDYYVAQTCQANQKDKLTHTGIFGAECTVSTMENFFGIDINYYARVNFTSLISMVDALGGITVNNPNTFSAGGFSFNAGDIQLNGAQALAFSRERYSFAAGDRERGKNQMRVITGMINKAISPSIIKNYTSILDAISGSFQTNMEQDEISALIKMQLNDMSGWEIIQQSVDGSGGTDWTPANGFNAYVMYPDMTTVDAAIAQIKDVLGTQTNNAS